MELQVNIHSHVSSVKIGYICDVFFFFPDVVFEVTLACMNVVGLFVNVLLLMGAGKVMSRGFNVASSNLTACCNFTNC